MIGGFRLMRGGSREATDGVVGQFPADVKKTTPALRATPPKEGNETVAVAKRLTGWSVTFLHTSRKPPRRFAPPLLRRGIKVGWSVTFLHTPRKPPRRLRRHPS